MKHHPVIGTKNCILIVIRSSFLLRLRIHASEFHGAPQNFTRFVHPWSLYTSASEFHAPQNFMQQVSPRNPGPQKHPGQMPRMPHPGTAPESNKWWSLIQGRVARRPVLSRTIRFSSDLSGVRFGFSNVRFWDTPSLGNIQYVYSCFGKINW